MKAVIFAGGVGTRLWPISRKRSPKQFEHIVGERSTLQLAVEKLLPEFSPNDIYISTQQQYEDRVAEQLSLIPRDHIIGEPVKRDVGPAVAYMMGYLAKRCPDEAVLILWSDHLVKHIDKFKKLIFVAREIVESTKDKIVFIGQKARFASTNLGWIEYGNVALERDETPVYSFEGFKYKPEESLAQDFFTGGKHCWNLGYFVSTPRFIYDQFKRYTPQIYEHVETILQKEGTDQFSDVFSQVYAEMPVISFDNAVLEQLDRDSAYVVSDDIGWSDVGSWEALKEALENKKDDVITKGTVVTERTTDSMIYNYEHDTMIVAIDVHNLLVVNTGDVLFVASKDKAGNIKKIVEGFEGTDHERFT